MIVLYFALDIMVTIADAILLSCIVTSLCKRKRGAWANWLPYIISVLVVVSSTWIIKNANIHTILIMTFIALSLLVSYKESIYKIVTCTLIYQAISYCVETIIFLTISQTLDNPFVIVDGKQFGVWPTYFLAAAFTIIAAYAFYSVFHDFQYELQPKDFITIIMCYLPFIVVSQLNLLAFFGFKSDWIRPFEWLFSVFLGLVVVLLLLYIKNFLCLREKSLIDKIRVNQSEQQFSYYQDKQAEDLHIRSLYHDMKNHLLLLEGHPENTDLINELKKQLDDFENYYNTGNDFLDVIIRDKARKARNQQIDFKCAIHFENCDFISPLDISTIFGNALDNAIEATTKLSPEERIITVKGKQIQEMLFIIVENSAKDGDTYKTSKTDTALHGFGIANIKKAAEKYSGEITTRYQDGKFELRIILPLP